MADRRCARLPLRATMRKTGHRAAAALAIVVAIGGFAHAADIKMAGKLDVPAGTTVIAICTDPVVQNVLNEDLRAARHGEPSNPDNSVTLTVTVNQQMLAPGVSLNEMLPGDPTMVRLLEQAGADPPPLGDSGDQATDPVPQEGRRQAMAPEDTTTE